MTTQQTKSDTEIAQPYPAQWKWALIVIIFAQCIFGLLYVLQVPLWMPSDERAHMRYIIDLATTGHLHIMHVGDSSYETHHPPLFYATAALMYKLLPLVSLHTQGVWLRLFCLVISVASTLLAADIVRKQLPGQKLLALAIISFFALNPSLIAINATITNDTLSFFLAVLTIWFISRHDFSVTTPVTAITLGIILGFGILCKVTQFPIAITAFLYLLISSSKSSRRNQLYLTGCMLLPMAVILSPWFLWNHAIYGAWTATSRLYGASPAYAQHPRPARSFHDFNIASMIAQSYLPTEFWLNQFKIMPVMKLTLLALTLLSIFGLILLFLSATRLQSSYRKLISFSLLLCLIHFLTFLSVDLLFSIQPIRLIFGSFFAFSVLWCAGINTVAQRLFTRNSPVFALSISLAFTVSTNIYLLMLKVPKLQDFGLHP